MTPGTYLRLRRQAAGLTIGEASHAAALRERGAAALSGLLTQLEDDQLHGPQFGVTALVMQLARAFKFDFGIWEVLAERALDPQSELPLPLICTGCGCSWNDPCSDPVTGPCAWRTTQSPAAPARCTLCPPAQGIAA